MLDNFSEFQNVISDSRPAPPSSPSSVIMTHCVRDSICDSPIILGIADVEFLVIFIVNFKRMFKLINKSITGKHYVEKEKNINLRIHKTFSNFKIKQRKCIKLVWKCIQYTIHWDKIQMLKKVSFRKNKRYRKCPLFTFASSNSLQFYF